MCRAWIHTLDELRCTRCVLVSHLGRYQDPMALLDTDDEVLETCTGEGQIDPEFESLEYVSVVLEADQ